MNAFSKNFKSFLSAFERKERESWITPLVLCFKEESKQTLLELYKREFLWNKEFLDTGIASSGIPENYRLLLQIIKQAEENLITASDFIGKFSKRQLLQSVANFLEKRNAELKYNASWNIKYADGDQRYLETERQVTYLTSAGIGFQELLKRFYLKASENNELEVVCEENTESSIVILLMHLEVYNEIKDTIERHLFFDWSLEITDHKILKTASPSNQRESKIETDLINSMKSKIGTEFSDEMAQDSLLKGYLDKIQNGKSKPPDFWKHVPSKDNKEEMDWFAEAYLLDVKADLKVETELTIVREQYFPGIEGINELELKETTQGSEKIFKLPLRETFRILGFLSELSKKHIAQIDKQYRDGVNHFASLYQTSTDSQIIEFTAKLLKGNKAEIKKTLEEHHNDKVSEEQDKIISGAKGKIDNENCLIQINYEKLVKTIQWIHQYDADFIKRVIEIFAYNSEVDVTRAPLFRMGNDLCWMPNLVAFPCFAESLIENLIEKKLIVIHKFQSNYYEKSLTNLFKTYGYNVLLNDKDKIFWSADGKKQLGDFDVLVFKSGILIHMQLKLTKIRNNYFDRWLWKENQLKEAIGQIETGNKYISENLQHIKKILGLGKFDEIIEHHSFIVSNSLLYDHDKIGGYLKIGYFEAMLSLIAIEKSRPGDLRNARRYVEFLNENGLFKNLEGMPFVHEDVTLKVGEYGIQGPRLVQKNVYTAL